MVSVYPRAIEPWIASVLSCMRWKSARAGHATVQIPVGRPEARRNKCPVNPEFSHVTNLRDALFANESLDLSGTIHGALRFVPRDVSIVSGLVAIVTGIG